MPITPLDLRKKTFAKVNFRGVDPKDVKDFLEQVARDMEALHKERSLLAEKVDELGARLEGYTRSEKAFQDAFLAAQQACTEQRDNARHESETIIERARIEADKITRLAQDEVATLDQDVNEIRMKRLACLSELRAVVDSFAKLIQHWESQDKSKART